MNIIHAIILGVVEGVTEFLPVSSTFHLIVSSKLLGLTQDDFTKLFEVFIQSGAILAVFLLYIQTVLKDRELMKKTIVSFIPTAVIGFVLYKIIKEVFFNSPYLMVGVFFLVGVLFVLFERSKKSKKLSRNMRELSYAEAIMVGLVQALAVIPGVSRAGAVLLSMMLLGYRRDEAARYSFILSIPTIFAASAFDLFKMRQVLADYESHFILLAVGFITAFISAYIVVKWLIEYLKTHTLTGFGIYRIVLAIILLLTIFR